MDLIVFSKDRAFQLHTSLETITKYVKGVDNIFVLFSYFEHIDLSKCSDIFLKSKNVSKYYFGQNYKLFDDSFFKEYDDDCVIVDRLHGNFGGEHINLTLKYSFNVSSCIHKKSDILDLLHSDLTIKNPVELEWKGADSNIFNKYQYTIYHKKEVVRQIHINNFLKRYEDVFGVDTLNELFLNKNEVIDISKINVDKFEPDMRWLNGEDIGRFPIFPWEIAPKYHEEIINNRRVV
jgi:hypothetical protein